MKGAVTVFSPWVNLERDVAQGETEAGGMLLRTLVALGLGAILLSVAVQVALAMWHHSAAIAAVEQAEQRAVSVAAELVQTLAVARSLPGVVHWVKGYDDAAVLTVISSETNVADSYHWHADGSLIVQRGGLRNSERLVDGISEVYWQPDASQQGGWLRVEAVSDSPSFTLEHRYHIGCRAAFSRACHVITRYVARPALFEGLQEALP